MGRQPPEPETPPRLAGRLVLRLVPGVDVLAEVIVAGGAPPAPPDRAAW